MSDKDQFDDLSEIFSIFKDATQEDTTQIVDKRKEQVISTNKNTTLSQYPDTMSCTTAFDELFACYSVGGQFKNLYRYGELTTCTDAYKKFQFCINNASVSRKSDKERKLEIQKFYKNQHLLTKAKGSSEDIWEIRK